MGKKESGKIEKWFKEKGFGFVKIDGYKKDAFLHISKLNNKSIKSEQLFEGYGIECEIEQGQKGPECKNVTIISIETETVSVENKKATMENGLFLPSDTKAVFNADTKEYNNPNLLFNKFPNFDREHKAKITDRFNIIFKDYYSEIKRTYIDRIESLKCFSTDVFKIEKKEYKIDWRLAIGLGEVTVYETSIKLHHIYGYPYIPASAFKGVIRNWVVNNYFEGDEAVASSNDFFSYVFGREKKGDKGENRGNVIFYDVNPVIDTKNYDYPKIEIDIINTHYSDYYKDGMTAPPSDDSNPSLVNFLTVKDGTFQFNYGYDTTYKMSIQDKERFGENLCKGLNKWIKDALAYQGLGAKTAVGYGYFSERAMQKSEKKISIDNNLSLEESLIMLQKKHSNSRHYQNKD